MHIKVGDKVQIIAAPEYVKQKIGMTGIVVMSKLSEEPNANGYVNDDLMISLDNGCFTFLQSKYLAKIGLQNDLK